MSTTKTDKQERLQEINDRFVQVMDELIKIRKSRDYIDFWEQLGFEKNLTHRTSFIKTHKQFVTIEVILLTGEVFNVNTNYIFGLEKEMFRGKG
ncbi:hypothetical protein ACTS9C_05495 [Empedobacter brevis]